MKKDDCIVINCHTLVPVNDDRQYIEAGDIKPGDTVYNQDGYPVTVKGVKRGMAYSITISLENDEDVQCDFNQGWLVKSQTEMKRLMGFHARETAEILSKQNSVIPYIWYVPIGKAIQRNEVFLKIDPYIMGMILGAGEFSAAEFRVSGRDELFAKMINSSIGANGYEKVNNGYYFLKRALAKYRDEHREYLIRSEVLDGFNQLISCINETVRIPNMYMNGSLEQRATFIKGLMDSAGEISKHDSSVSFVTVSEGLSIDLANLAAMQGINSNQSRLRIKNGETSYNAVVTTLLVPDKEKPELFKNKSKLIKDALRGKKGESFEAPVRIINMYDSGVRSEMVQLITDAEGILISRKHIIINA